VKHIFALIRTKETPVGEGRLVDSFFTLYLLALMFFSRKLYRDGQIYQLIATVKTNK